MTRGAVPSGPRSVLEHVPCWTVQSSTSCRPNLLLTMSHAAQRSPVVIETTSFISTLIFLKITFLIQLSIGILCQLVFFLFSVPPSDACIYEPKEQQASRPAPSKGVKGRPQKMTSVPNKLKYSVRLKQNENGLYTEAIIPVLQIVTFLFIFSNIRSANSGQTAPVYSANVRLTQTSSLTTIVCVRAAPP